MPPIFDICCPMSDCQNQFTYKCETEDSGDGSEHEATCPECKRVIHFEIAYLPITCNETYRGEIKVDTSPKLN